MNYVPNAAGAAGNLFLSISFRPAFCPFVRALFWFWSFEIAAIACRVAEIYSIAFGSVTQFK